MRQFEPVDKVIRDIVAFDGYDYEMTARAVKRAFQYLITNALVDDGIKYFNNIKSEFVVIKDNLTATLPKNVDDVIKVGYVFSDAGRTETRYLGRRRFIHRQDLKSAEIIYPTCTCATEDVSAATTAANTQLLSQYQKETLGADSLVFHNMQGYGEIYNYPAVMYENGIYTVDYDNNRLVFDSGFDTQIGNQLIVEYKTTLTNESYNYVPLIAFSALRYKALEFLDKNTDKMLFLREAQRIKTAAHPITIDDLMQVLSGGHTLKFRS